VINGLLRPLKVQNEQILILSLKKIPNIQIEHFLICGKCDNHCRVCYKRSNGNRKKLDDGKLFVELIHHF
jgi:MinD superfamily P-loop ATPase